MLKILPAGAKKPGEPGLAHEKEVVVNKNILTENARKFLYCIIIYLTAIAGYSFYSYSDHKSVLMEELDKRLLLSAKALKYMLAPDFHDRATAADSITFEEELANREAVSGFAFESGFEWAYTLVEKDGRFYFSAPSVSEEEALEQESWYFHPYEDVPEEFIKAFHDNEIVYTQYSDQWGTWRSIALPQHSPGGKRYLSCVDADINYVRGILIRNIVVAVLTATFFLACALPFVFLVQSVFKRHNMELKTLNNELEKHRESLEELVKIRTGELEKEKERLLEAINNVKVLSGLVPICSSCKKIRDDTGYWNQIEAYIEKHSDALFSHGICPECIQRMYPDIDLPEADTSSGNGKG